MTRPHTVAVDAPHDLEQPKPLASWYAEGTSDGLGDRLLMFDNAGTPSLELLRFRRHLADADGFEDALREQVARLQPFRHLAFPEARAVERLEGGAGLTLVSTFTAGKRLAEIFRGSRARAGVHPAFAAWLIRDLTSAVADLQRQGTGIAHGALTPDRIVLTAEGRLVIVEHVLGAALARLQLPADRVRQELGLVAPETSDGRARLDCRTDVIQIGWLALSVLLGRRISPADYPHRLEGLFEEFAQTSGSRSPALVPGLRRWLERALQLEGPMFESALEAQDALAELGVHAVPHAIEYMAKQPAIAPAAEPPQAAVNADRALPPFESPLEDRMARDHSPSDDALALERIAHLRNRQQLPEPSSANAPVSRVKWPWAAAALFALFALVEAGVIGRLVSARQPAAATPTVPIVFDSLEPGDAVIVDGRQVGVTPLEVKLRPDMRSIRVQARTGTPRVEVVNPIPAPPIADRPGNTPGLSATTLPASPERRGGLRLSSPIEIQVLEGERVLGSSADGPIVTTAGRHELDFINGAFGYRSRQVVNIKAGQIVAMTVAPPEGKVSVNALPWAQVWINGSLMGDTPLANVPLAVGEYQITFRHPQLGEQTQKVVVKSAALTRVSATFAR
jgi:hypothetical protein